MLRNTILLTIVLSGAASAVSGIFNPFRSKDTITVKYPTNSREIELINSAMETEKDSPRDGIEASLESLRARLEQLQHFGSKDERASFLLEIYLGLSKINEENCTLEHADYLVLLLHIHQHEPESNSFKYLQEITIRQFQLCLPKWDQEFAEAVESIDYGDRMKMEMLLDQMMQIKFKNEEQPSRPYKRVLLRRLIANPPASAILLFMTTQDPGERRLPVDGNLKNHSFKMDDFRKIYSDFVLGLCTNVCNSLENAAKIFRPANDYNLERKDYIVSYHHRDTWIANMMIGCSIKRSHERMAQTGHDNFLESTFEQLTVEGEIMVENDLGLDELIEFGDTLGDY